MHEMKIFYQLTGGGLFLVGTVFVSIVCDNWAEGEPFLVRERTFPRL